MVSGYDSLLPGGDLIYTLRDGSGRALTVLLDLGEMDKGGVSDLQATAYKPRGELTPAELALFSDQLSQFAVKCFNIDPARRTEIRAWVLNARPAERPFGQTVPGLSAQKSFGPLQMTLWRWKNREAHSVTVNMTRSGRPQEGKWINYCLPSG